MKKIIKYCFGTFIFLTATIMLLTFINNKIDKGLNEIKEVNSKEVFLKKIKNTPKDHFSLQNFQRPWNDILIPTLSKKHSVKPWCIS